MDLEQAVEQADTIAQKNNLGPSNYHYAAMFHTDAAVKTFVELEAGGTDALVNMMDEKLYMPYTWKVRHFKEHEKNESLISFTPDGQPYGFIETISENIPGAQLSEKDARIIAETYAETQGNIVLSDYKLVEASQKTQLSKRIDHTFVYERNDKKIGEGNYRLKIVVSGDKVTELTHFVKVPEAFTRRYEEMRSANTIIAFAATLLMALLYFFGGCCLGLYWINKKKWLLLKQPLRWAFFLALISALNSVNQLPFLWMKYNNAFSLYGFLSQLFLSCFISFIAQTFMYTIIIAAAESLTRRAFGNHPQLWTLCSAESSSSYAILGRTVGGYLLVGFNVAFVIAFYIVSLRYLGWWSPSEMLFDPNILASYAPWFSPLASSLNAGFIEECVFRAIPLAGAALLGTYFGKRNWWIAAALILQAIVFGAAHANYPVQPSYARLVELFIPSLIWGIIYLRFGLITTIISHFAYDVIWFSIPIFVSFAPDTLLYKILIIIGALLPLLYVLFARLKKGKWNHLPESAHNHAWQPSTSLSEEKEEKEAVPQESLKTSTTTAHKTIIGLGIISLIVWIYGTRFTHDGITITCNRQEAVTFADSFLAEKNSILTAPWKTLPLIFTHYKLVPDIAQQHTFIWKKGKKDLYHALLGTYLEPAHWTIRYAQFDTDIIERTQEHKIMLYNDSVWRYHHQLPESSIGASLTQEQARSIAHKTLSEQYNLDHEQLREISAVQAQLPHRINWLFIFEDSAVYPLQTGRALVSILIAGDEVVYTTRTIQVPEEWERKQQNKQNILNIVMMVFSLILLLFLLIGLVVALRQKKNVIISKKLLAIIFGVSLFLGIIDILNTWPSIVGNFSTSLPFNNQLFQIMMAFAFSSLLKSSLYALILSYVLSFKTHTIQYGKLNVYSGICCGLFMAGIIKIAQTALPLNMPLWPEYDALGCSIPLLASCLNSIAHYIQLTISFSLLYILVDNATIHWQKNRLFFTILAMLCGMAMVDLPSLRMLPLWLAAGAIIGKILLLLYQHIMQYNYSVIPFATGSFIILKLIQQGMFNAYPGAALAAIVNVCAIGGLSALWHEYLNKTK